MRAVRNLLTAALVLASPAAFAQTIAPPAGNLPFGAHQLVARMNWIIRTSWQGRDKDSMTFIDTMNHKKDVNGVMMEVSPMRNPPEGVGILCAAVPGPKPGLLKAVSIFAMSEPKDMDLTFATAAVADMAVIQTLDPHPRRGDVRSNSGAIMGDLFEQIETDSNSGQPLVAAVQRDGLEFVIDAKPYKGKVIDVFAVTTDH